MPIRRLTALGAACIVCLASALLAGTASAGTTTAHIRVVNTQGATLVDQSQVTGDVTIKTDPGADCFGAGTGGSGSNIAVPGPTALGILKDASETVAALRPLSTTDSFYPAFGLGLCGVGNMAFHPGDKGFWYFKVNHAGSNESGSQYTLKSGDDVLWYESPGFPAPNELQLIAPTTAQAGKPFPVTVFAYDDAGTRSPVSGAFVTGAELPTRGDGTTMVQLTQSVSLQALHLADIPSNRPAVCVLTQQNTCGAARNKIVGTRGKDRIRGTKMADQVRARGGDDRINVRGGLPDRVNCGAGRDRAIIGINDVAHHCEKVIRKR